MGKGHVMTDPEIKDFLKVFSENGKTSDDSFLLQAALRVFPRSNAVCWLSACRKIESAGYGELVLNSYIRNSLEIAHLVSDDIAIEFADIVSSVAIKAGSRNAEFLSVAARKAAIRLGHDKAHFEYWMALMERFAGLAPESMLFVLEKMDDLLSKLSISGLEAWILAGIRSAGSDSESRLSFFSFKDTEAERWLRHESSAVVFSEIDRELKAYIGALWGIRVPIREPPTSTPYQVRRRASFSPGVISIPSSFPGFWGEQAVNLFRAVIAHIGAHMQYSSELFSVAKLKPIQVALISLIEDARVEQLAIRDFPGLRRLWLPFHVAKATGAQNAPSLMARLSRALIDADFKDDDGWICKASEMFYDRKNEWENPLISREIGGLIGNDLGQMRVQFNSRTYVNEPPYRDDNLGLWNFSDIQAPETMEEELFFNPVHLQEQEESDDSPPDREHEEHKENNDNDASKLAINFVEEEGVQVARYPEYDYVTGHSRPDWVTIVEYPPAIGSEHMIDEILEEQATVVNRIKSLITSAKVSRPQKIRRQPEGEFLDLNACIETMISHRIGENPDPQVYGRSVRRNRDLSVLVLLDVSESTNDKIIGNAFSVLDLERQATALLAHAMAGLGDPFAIAAFSSNRREEVRYHRVKDFGSPYGPTSKSYLAGLKGAYSTRIGAAMRHAAEDLKEQLTHHRLLLVVTDGEPSDIDVTDNKYLVEDARHVIHSMAMDGIYVFCVGLDSGGDSYLHRIFGQRNVVLIDRLERLPEKLPMLYFRLTA